MLDALDRAGDAVFERVRGRRGPDAIAAVVSNLSDYGLVWVLLAATKARRRGPARRRAVVSLALAGICSYGVNRAVKQLVRRERPAARDTSSDALPVRRPTSPSFPSGHTLAAFTTAVVLADGPAQTGTALAFAATVAASRVHLRAHHTSDVVAGAAIGLALGAAVRAGLRRAGVGWSGRQPE